MARYHNSDYAKENGRKPGTRSRRIVANLVGKFSDVVSYTEIRI
jgi:hypothetical protein